MPGQIECDVIVVGLGPSGMLATACLLQKGWRVAVIEKHAAPYGLPRAGHVDHEIVRFLQGLDIDEPFLDDAYPINSYRWFNGAGQVLLEMNWGGQSVSGFNSDYMMYQPVLEDCIYTAIDRHSDRLTLLRNREVVSTEQTPDGAICRATGWRLEDGKVLTDPDDEIVVTGRYLLACDGARSSIREALQIPREDLGFNEVWLDVDVRVLRPLPAMDPHQVCDPARPIFISPLGKRHHRFEWAILPGEDPRDFDRPERAWELLQQQGVGPEDVQIVRQQVYTFEARIAERWNEGRIFLLGDAAHTMPPFMGQGACAGMRDAVNLAWKLDLVLSDAAGPALLDSYQIEREPHARTWIELSMRTGEISCTLDVQAAAERDAMLLGGEAPPMPEFPELDGGILDLGPDGAVTRPVGTLLPQREVTARGRTGWIDDIAGGGFRILSWGSSAEALLDDEQRELLARIGARFVVFGDEDVDGRIGDDSGFYRDWMTDGGFEAVIVRPDHQIFGVASRIGEIGRLVDLLANKLGIAAAMPAPKAAHG